MQTKGTRTEQLLALGVFGRGSRLRERIEILLERGREFSPRVSASRVAVSVIALLGCVIAGALAPRLIAFAQAAPQFDVASVKPEPWTGQGGVLIKVTGNTLTAEHQSLFGLVSFAYDLLSVQLSGGPAWARPGLLAGSELYQVIAKAAGDPPPSAEQFRLMLQGLLSDRFKLQVHHVNKELPVYNLVVAKGGLKLKESDADAKFSMVTRAGRQSNRTTGKHVPMATLVSGIIENYAGRPVFDKTGLTGTYDFEVEWVQDSLRGAGPDTAVSDSNGPSLFTAIQEQLGLKLEPGVAPFDTVVIDHAEKPDAN
jgi:uncharacterized protein (TIGR03435 family)